MWTSCAAFRSTRIGVQSDRMQRGKADHQPQAARLRISWPSSHAAMPPNRRRNWPCGKRATPRVKMMQSTWRRCVARFWPASGMELGVKQASKKQRNNGCRSGVPMLSRAHDNAPHLQHPQFLHRRPYRPWQIDARRPPDPDHRRAGGARDEGAGARFDGYRARARHHHQGADRPAELSRPRTARTTSST